jgi:outer membrane immunogenic protein
LPALGEQKHSKFTGGGYAGYNFCVTPSLIVGLEADFTKYGHARNWSGVAGGNVYGADFDANWGVSLRARIGLPFDCFLVYATGGIAGAQLSTDLYRRAADVTTLTNSVSKFAIGYVAGVGRVEYLYTGLGNVSLGTSKSSATFNAIRLGFAYKS